MHLRIKLEPVCRISSMTSKDSKDDDVLPGDVLAHVATLYPHLMQLYAAMDN